MRRSLSLSGCTGRALKRSQRALKLGQFHCALLVMRSLDFSGGGRFQNTPKRTFSCYAGVTPFASVTLSRPRHDSRWSCLGPEGRVS